MANKGKSARVSRQLRQSEINLVSARSAMSNEVGLYSRGARQSGYAKQRSRRVLKKRILTGITVTFSAVLVGLAAFVITAYLYINSALSSGLDMKSLEAVMVDRNKPEDPFWMLLVGTNYDEDGSGIARSDVIILAHIDPGHQNAALVSIPRDTMVTLPGYGVQKINAAYAYGQMERANGDELASGPASLIKAVSDLTGAEIAAYAQIDFDGLIAVVDAMGGVFVDVPLDIIGDREAGPVDVYAGEQVLDGAHALVFCRSRQYAIGDFQRQANQRTLLQAVANQTLAKDPLTIANTVRMICEMVSTNLQIADIVSVAQSMHGIKETDIHSYTLPSSLANVNAISYVVVDEYQTQQLVAAINAGTFPDYSGQDYQGEVAERYKNREGGTATDHQANMVSTVDATQYYVSVRNGWGIAGSATAVSDMLALAGYRQHEIGNANSYVYDETLVIYRDDTDREAAEDIRARLGYGRVIPSLGRYSFEGNILVIVGGDFAG